LNDIDCVTDLTYRRLLCWRYETAISRSWFFYSPVTYLCW